jgi:transposase
MRTRLLIVLHADHAMPKLQIARAVGCSRQTVHRVIERFIELGEAGLVDRPEDNGDRKIDTGYVSMLKLMLEGGPRDFGHRRPTWTHRLLIDVADRYTGIRISRRSMGRLLRQLRVRRGRCTQT